MKRLGLGLIPLSLLLVFASSFLVRARHLTERGLQRDWRGQPFTGIAVEWYRDYQPAMLATYWKGQHHGLEITWFPGGARESLVFYADGLYHGTSQSWYADGRIRTWRNYEKGLAEGEQWSWGPAGQVLEFNVFQRDQEITHKTWTFDGRPFHNYVYQGGEKVGILGEPFCKRQSRPSL